LLPGPKLALHQMEIILLGTGTAIPIERHSPAGLIVKAGGECLLLDIGPGTLGRLHLAGVNCSQIDHLLLTHLHPDHTLDLATLLLVFNYAPNAERTSPFPITGCRGLRDFYARMAALYPEIVPSTFELQLHEVDQDEFSVGKLKIKCAPTGHTLNSVAYRLDDGRHSLVYSGDASPRGELAGLASGTDMLISECSFPSGWETEDHLNADTLGEIAQQAGVKSVVVVHTYPPALVVDLIGQIGRRYHGDVQVGVDGLHLSL
jgi:ribonuclease Z